MLVMPVMVLLHVQPAAVVLMIQLQARYKMLVQTVVLVVLLEDPVLQRAVLLAAQDCTLAVPRT